MGLVNALLTLPASKQLLALPKEQHAPLAAVMNQLREQAVAKATKAKEKGDEYHLEYWRLVATFAQFVHRALKREAIDQDKAQMYSEMMEILGLDRRQRDVSGLIGLESFKLPEITLEHCILRADRLAFSPWVEVGDMIEVDFMPTRLVGAGLYIVAIEGAYVAIRGFHQNGPKWWVHEGDDAAPRPVTFKEDGHLRPDGFQILGRVTQVFRSAGTIGGLQ